MLINLHIEVTFIIKAFQKLKNSFKISFNMLLPNDIKFKVYKEQHLRMRLNRNRQKTIF